MLTSAEQATTRRNVPARPLAHLESWKDHVDAWRALGHQVEDAMWGRAAVAASLRHRYGDEAIEKFADEVGQAPRTIWRLAQVHLKFVENCRRRQNLTFSHHAEALIAKDPSAALGLAETKNWSAQDLRDHLRTERRAHRRPVAAHGYCTVEGCERREDASGLCYGHRKRQQEGLPLAPPLRESDLSAFERVLECIKAIDEPQYDGDEGEHAWQARLRAACWDWLDPGEEIRRLAKRRSHGRKVVPRWDEGLK